MKVASVDKQAAERAGSDRFVGEVHIQPLAEATAATDIAVAVVRFSPGARTYLHSHDTMQVLFCVEGKGILATRQRRNLVKPGMIVQVPAGEIHWHGASDDSAFVHLSIITPGETVWTKIDPLES